MNDASRPSMGHRSVRACPAARNRPSAGADSSLPGFRFDAPNGCAAGNAIDCAKTHIDCAWLAPNGALPSPLNVMSSQRPCRETSAWRDDHMRKISRPKFRIDGTPPRDRRSRPNRPPQAESTLHRRAGARHAPPEDWFHHIAAGELILRSRLSISCHGPWASPRCGLGRRSNVLGCIVGRCAMSRNAGQRGEAGWSCSTCGFVDAPDRGVE